MNKKNSGRLSMFSSLARGYWFLLIASVAASILAIVFNYLTPQVFRFTVDTVLGDEPSALPGFLTAWLNPDKQDVIIVFELEETVTFLAFLNVLFVLYDI